MSTDPKQPEVTVKSSEERIVERSKDFWGKYSKLIVGVLVAIVVIVGGFFAYNNFVKGPAEVAANEAIWRSQLDFKTDSFQRALVGTNTKNNPGFVKIAKNHSGTKAGNLANYYAGICYLRLGDFNNAIKYLEEYSPAGDQMKILAAGALGDAYAEINKNDKAIENYKVAATAFESDDYNSSEFLYRLAQMYDKTGKTNEAIEAFTSLRQKFPRSMRAYEVEKYLGKLGVTK